MKSQHRHELETNVLADRLGDYIDRFRDHLPTIVGTLVAIAAVVFGVSYFSTASATREQEAWNTYNTAIGGQAPNMEQLRLAAEEYPDSPMQEFADVTWADGQVFNGSRLYLMDHQMANASLQLAEGTYQSLLAESEDARIKSRARYGLARIYELRNELDRARQEYLAVDGDFAPLAKLRAEALAKPSVKETYEWLVTAEAPRATAPMGPGVPGQRPDFSAGDMEMPAERSAAPATGGSLQDTTGDLFKDLGIPQLPAQSEDRYGTGGETPAGDAAGATDDPLMPQQPAGEAAP